MRAGYVAWLAALLAVTPVWAQPPHPECAKLPGGGRLKVEVPGPIVPPTCQACVAGTQVPANFVLGFSDASSATCELKAPDGRNSGLCRADTQCPGRSQRIKQGNVWVCQMPPTSVEVTCPAAVRVNTPSAVAGPSRIAPPPCAEQLKDVDQKIKEREAAGRRAIAEEAALRGTALATSAGKRVEATALLAAALAHYYAEVSPMTVRWVAACDNVDKDNKTAVADCDRAAGDYHRSLERWWGIYTRFQNADRTARREWDAATQADAGSSGRALIDQIGRDTADAARQVEACIAEARRLAPRPF